MEQKDIDARRDKEKSEFRKKSRHLWTFDL